LLFSENGCIPEKGQIDIPSDLQKISTLSFCRIMNCLQISGTLAQKNSDKGFLSPWVHDEPYWLTAKQRQLWA